MRIISILVLLIGLGIAGSVAFMVIAQLSAKDQLIAQLQGKVAKNVKFVKVPVAKSDLKYGKVLTKKDVKYVTWPTTSVPKAAFKTDEELFGEKDADKEPRTVLRTIDEGEIISTKKVSGFGEGAGLSTILEKGMRAFALRVDVASGVSGFLRPGDKIDVFWTGRVGNETISQLILDGIELIAIDQIADADRNRPIVARTVTVAASPQIVASLAQAQATGKLQLSLRGVEDDTVSGPIEIDQRKLLGIEAAAPKAKRKVCTINVRGADGIKKVEIPCKD